MSGFIPQNEDEREAMKTFRETGSPSGLNAIGLTVKIVKLAVPGAVAYEIIRRVPEVQQVIANVFTNGG